MIVQNLLQTEMTSHETKEETQLILQCAENIMGHLNRLVESEAQAKYVDHREVLSRMISSCESDLGQELYAVTPLLS